jgi:hypothetical protein
MSRELAPGVVADVYPTGAGSPIAHMYVVDASHLSADQLMQLGTETARPGTIRLYRGIGSTFQPAKGSNFFSGEPAIALNYARGGTHPAIVMVDVPTIDLANLTAYRELQGLTGQRMSGMSEGGLNVVQLPKDWLSGQPVDQAIYRDMQGLHARIEAEQEALGDWRSLLGARAKAEDKAILNNMQKTGRKYKEISPEERYDLVAADPEARAAHAALNAHSDNERALLTKFARKLPTLNPPTPGVPEPILTPEGFMSPLKAAGMVGAIVMVAPIAIDMANRVAQGEHVPQAALDAVKDTGKAMVGAGDWKNGHKAASVVQTAGTAAGLTLPGLAAGAAMAAGVAAAPALAAGLAVGGVVGVVTYAGISEARRMHDEHLAEALDPQVVKAFRDTIPAGKALAVPELNGLATMKAIEAQYGDRQKVDPRSLKPADGRWHVAVGPLLDEQARAYIVQAEEQIDAQFQQHHAELEQRFGAVLGNKDGTLTAAELKAALLPKLATIDRNGDGISEQDIIGALTPAATLPAKPPVKQQR